MKKTFIIGLLSISCFAFSQNKKSNFINLPKKELYKLFSNSAVSKEMYPEEKEDERQIRFKEYFCLIKTYKVDFSKDSNFITTNEVHKEIENLKKKGIQPAEALTEIENLNLLFKLQIGYYKTRWDFYDNHKKCLDQNSYKH